MDTELMQRQVLGPVNYSDKKCYIISKENYEYFLKSSDKQIIGRLKGEGMYYVISKETTICQTINNSSRNKS